MRIMLNDLKSDFLRLYKSKVRIITLLIFAAGRRYCLWDFLMGIRIDYLYVCVAARVRIRNLRKAAKF
ncbi:MAG: hypothetical protein HUJ51_00410 [Eggerthellaceae bacterium]|nr:hypothetical protein [Eggerthellaceae bacterium]